MKVYLDRNQIIRLAASTETFNRGANYFREDRVEDCNYYEDMNMVSTTVQGNEHIYTCRIEFDDNGNLVSHSCTCEAHILWKGACKHVVASLLQLFNNNKDIAFQAKNKRLASEMLSAVEEKALDRLDRNFPQPSEGYKLIPVLELDKELLSLSFTTGVDKQYIVRNIQDFLDLVKKEEHFEYGKGLAYTHKLSNFDAMSRDLIELLRREIDRYKYAYTLTHGEDGAYLSLPIAREVTLTKNGLDEFFKLYIGVKLKAIKDKKSIPFYMTEEPFPLQFSLEEADDGVILHSQGKNMDFLFGQEEPYVIWQNRLYLLERDRYEAVAPVIKTMQEINSTQLYFSGTDQEKLAVYLVPELKENDFLSDELEIVERKVPLKTKIYMDINSGKVEARMLFTYNDEEVQAMNKEKDVEAYRDLIGEYRMLRLIRSFGFKDAENDTLLVLSDEDALYEFFMEEGGLSQLRDVAEVFVTNAFLTHSKKPPVKPSVGIRYAGNLLTLDFDLDGFTEEEIQVVLTAIKEEKKYTRLKNGQFVDLDDDSVFVVKQLMEDLKIKEEDLAKGEVDLPSYQAYYLETLQGEEDIIKMDASVKQLLADTGEQTAKVEMPKGLKAELRDYQKEGLRWLQTQAKYGFGGVLADDMGLGKTIQMIALILWEKENSKDMKPSLVVAPTSLVYNWEKEFHKFAPSLDIMTVAGSAKTREEHLQETADVYITTYDMLKRDQSLYESTDFKYIIADEAQYIKNPATQNAKVVKSLKGESNFALTGTPIENALSELWSIFDFVMPGYLHSEREFAKEFEIPIMKEEDKETTELLKKLIGPFILRRVKEDVLLELPEKIETTLYADMTEEQEELYRQHFLMAQGELMEAVEGGELPKRQMEILSLLLRLRQICCHPAVFKDGYTGGSGKMDLVLETIETSLESGNRILLFSQFTKMLALIKDKLDERGYSYYYLDGQTEAKDRIKMSEKFNEGEKEIFLISLKAGGTGLNLTGANVVIHFDPWWNPAVMEQAADRAHRIGQEEMVQVFHLVAKDSIEEKILELQEKKKDLMDSVLDEGAQFINQMSEDELKDLFSIDR